MTTPKENASPGRTDSDLAQQGSAMSRLQVEVSFASPEPRIAELPHLILRSDRAALETILGHLGMKAGIFGNAWPRVDADGDPYVPPEDDERVIDAFGLWSLSANQDDVTDWCRGRDSIPIAWLIPADTDPATLAMMHEPWKDWEDYPFYIDRLADWLGALPWAVVPLEHEGEFVMLAVCRAWSAKLDGWVTALEADGFEVFRLQSTPAGWQWPGPIQRLTRSL